MSAHDRADGPAASEAAMTPVAAGDEIVVLGAGLAGMSTAYHLRAGGHRAVRVFEREATPGGLVRTHREGDYRFDFTGHFLHLRDPGMRRLVARWCPDGFLDVARDAWIHSHQVFTPYPFQTNLHGLPLPVVKECLLGYIAACGVARGVAQGDDAAADPAADPVADQAPSFARWVRDSVGEGIARHFMLPYNEKLWGVPLDSMTTDWMTRFVPPAPLDKVVAGALGLRDANAGYNARFAYPVREGIQYLSDRVAAHAGPIDYQHTAIRIDSRARVVHFANGARAGYRRLVSTLPLPVLCDLLDDLPDAVRRARDDLRWSAVWSLCLGVRADHTEGRHWVYLPEPEYAFYRAGCFSNVAPSMAPPGHAAIWVERSYNRDRPLDAARARADSIAGLKRMGWLHDDAEIATEWQLRIPYAYVIYDRNHAAATRTIHAHLRTLGIHATGRYGRWEYSSMEDALLHGRDAARLLLGDRVPTTPNRAADDLK